MLRGFAIAAALLVTDFGSACHLCGDPEHSAGAPHMHAASGGPATSRGPVVLGDRSMFPRNSDVFLKSVQMHNDSLRSFPSGCDHVCVNTLKAAAAFNATRVDWIYLDPTGDGKAFLAAAAAQGVAVNAAVNANMPDRPQCHDERGCTRIGRFLNLDLVPINTQMAHWVTPPMYEAGAYGCINNPDYEAIKFGFIDRALAAGAGGFIQDDWGMNAEASHWHSNKTQLVDGCFCEHCMVGFTSFLLGGNSTLNEAKLRSLNITSSAWSYRDYGLRVRAGAVDSDPELAAAFQAFQVASTDAHARRMLAHGKATGVKLGRKQPVEFAMNGLSAGGGDADPRIYDYGEAELSYGVQGGPLVARIWDAIALGKSQVFTMPKRDGMQLYKPEETVVVRAAIALAYAAGGNMLVPWDIYLGQDGHRYWGRVEDYGDLFAFIRAHANLLDGFVPSVAAGGHYGDASQGTGVRANSSELLVLPRTPVPAGADSVADAAGGSDGALAVIHVVNHKDGTESDGCNRSRCVFDGSDCSGHDLGAPHKVATSGAGRGLAQCETLCKASPECKGLVLDTVKTEIGARCGAVAGEACCLLKSECSDIVQKQGDTVVSYGRSARGKPAGLLLSLSQAWVEGLLRHNAGAPTRLLGAATEIKATLLRPGEFADVVLPVTASGGVYSLEVSVAALKPWGMVRINQA